LLERLPVIEPDAHLPADDLAQWHIAMVRYSFLIQAYVWGEPDAPTRIPEPIARPIWAIAEKTGQKPLLPYASYVLDNWGKVDPDGGFGLDNLYMIQKFLGGQDEAWFVIVHVAIEATAGSILAAVPELIAAAARREGEAMTRLLEGMDGVWDEVNAIFDRMPERCDPYIYFHRVRPYIHGWQDNPALPQGLVYEGVEATGGAPQAFRGQTGSQSSIVPSMDALLQLGHEDDPLKRYLEELHEYRPPAHRRFIEDIRARSTVREVVKSLGDERLKDAYNANVSQVARFRTRHLEYAASYINKQGGKGGNDADVGTGGTPFMRYLKKHRDESQAQLL
jgi:indoleamine 2,3-dioxygenase